LKFFAFVGKQSTSQQTGKGRKDFEQPAKGKSLFKAFYIFKFTTRGHEDYIYSTQTSLSAHNFN